MCHVNEGIIKFELLVLLYAMDFECGGFTFLSNFDSGNLARVELVPQKTHGNPAHTKKQFWR